MIKKNERVFQLFNCTLLFIVCLLMIAPMLHVLAISLSESRYVDARLVSLFPRGFNINVYKKIFGMISMLRALGVSIIITIAGTLLCLILNSMLAYSLSRQTMKGRRVILKGILLTYVLSIPLIPYYMVVRNVRLENTLFALIIPGSVGAFYVFIMITNFKSVSSELYDSAKIDGCNEFGIYIRIILPLSKAVMSTIALYHAVGQWNSYFGALIFIRKRTLYPLQIILRDLILEFSDNPTMDQAVNLELIGTPEMMKAGVIIFATIPILIVYPFLQKYFIKGAMLGSLKE